jgi:uncharacterized phage protein (TIGR01671 family)
MNRQLKFRIWDKQYCHWLKNSSSFHCNSNWTICPFTGNVVDYVETCDENGENFSASPANDYYWEDGKLIKEPRYITQQYTRMKDKNGKEIYEGDIVKYARFKVESTEFAKGCFSSKAIEIGEEIGEILFIKPSFCLSFDHIRYDDIMPMCLAEHRYEVIGNIFENKELLNQ